MADFTVQHGVKASSDVDISTLVTRAKQDPGAFAALYDHYVQSIYRYLFSRVANTQDAQDLTAQTFLSALEALPSYHHKGHFSAWLFRIARNKAMDYFRNRRHEPRLDLEEQRGDTPDMLGQMIQDQEVQRLASFVRSLKEAEQELIRLRYVAGLSFTEMAALLGKKDDTVKKSLYRLLARLENQMEVPNE